MKATLPQSVTFKCYPASLVKSQLPDFPQTVNCNRNLLAFFKALHFKDPAFFSSSLMPHPLQKICQFGTLKMPHLEAPIGLRINITATICSEGSNEMGTPSSGWAQTQAESRLPTAKHRITTPQSQFWELKPFRIIYEVARPCSFGLTTKDFVDFGSHKTNPKYSLSGAAAQTAFAACWEEQDDLTGRRKKKALLRNAVPPLPPAHRASQGRHPSSRHCSLADPPKEMTWCTFLPAAEQLSGVEGLKTATHCPAFATSPEDWVGDGLPLTCPHRQLHWLTGWANKRQAWKQEPGAGWVCTNNETEWINQVWLLASLQGTFH